MIHYTWPSAPVSLICRGSEVFANDLKAIEDTLRLWGLCGQAPAPAAIGGVASLVKAIQEDASFRCGRSFQHLREVISVAKRNANAQGKIVTQLTQLNAASSFLKHFMELD